MGIFRKAYRVLKALAELEELLEEVIQYLDSVQNDPESQKLLEKAKNLYHQLT